MNCSGIGRCGFESLLHRLLAANAALPNIILALSAERACSTWNGRSSINKLHENERNATVSYKLKGNLRNPQMGWWFWTCGAITLVDRFQNFVRNTSHSLPSLLTGSIWLIKVEWPLILTDKGHCVFFLPSLAPGTAHIHKKYSEIIEKWSAKFPLKLETEKESLSSSGRSLSSLTTSWQPITVTRWDLHISTRVGEPARPWTRQLFHLCDYQTACAPQAIGAD